MGKTLVEKTVMEPQWHLGKEKVLGVTVNKEGHADILLGHERTHHYWFHWKRCNSKLWFLLPNDDISSYLLNDSHIYIYIYIYIYI